jgi:hypothetical protein
MKQSTGLSSKFMLGINGPSKALLLYAFMETDLLIELNSKHGA